MAQSQKQNELQHFSRFCAILSRPGLDAPMCGVLVVHECRLSPLFRLQGAHSTTRAKEPASKSTRRAATCKHQNAKRQSKGRLLGKAPFSCSLPNAPALGHSLYGGYTYMHIRRVRDLLNLGSSRQHGEEELLHRWTGVGGNILSCAGHFMTSRGAGSDTNHPPSRHPPDPPMSPGGMRPLASIVPRNPPLTLPIWF